MLNKVLLGTANFMKPYGVLSQGQSVSLENVQTILAQAKTAGLKGLDTAFAYGDISEVIGPQLTQGLDLITKISVLDNPDDLIPRLQAQDINFYGILIHDPQNLEKIDPDHVRALLSAIKDVFPKTKLGISAYDPDEVYAFAKIFSPELIQIPLNPFNQIFNTDKFKAYKKENKIEVHARSLFLQGILLADVLPKGLEPLQSNWQELKNRIQENPLQAILTWAMAQDLVDAWVLGVSCVNDLAQISAALPQSQTSTVLNFPPVDHPLVNPKNWTFLS